MQAKCHRVVFLIQIYGGEDTKPADASRPRDGEGVCMEEGLKGILNRSPTTPLKKKTTTKKQTNKQTQKSRKKKR